MPERNTDHYSAAIPSNQTLLHSPYLNKNHNNISPPFHAIPAIAYQDNKLPISNQTSTQQYYQNSYHPVGQDIHFTMNSQVNPYNSNDQNSQNISFAQRPPQHSTNLYERSFHNANNNINKIVSPNASIIANNVENSHYLIGQQIPIPKNITPNATHIAPVSMPLSTGCLPSNKTFFPNNNSGNNNNGFANNYLNRNFDFDNETVTSLKTNNLVDNVQSNDTRQDSNFERKTSVSSGRKFSSSATSINSITSRKNSTDHDFSNLSKGSLLDHKVAANDLKQLTDTLVNNSKKLNVINRDNKRNKNKNSNEKKKGKDIDIITNVFTNEVDKDNENKTTLKANKIYTVNFTNAVKLRKQCPICAKVCSRPSTLKTHYLIHTGDTPFNCTWPSCKKSFNVKSNMLRHVKSHARKLEKQQKKLNNLAIKRK